MTSAFAPLLGELHDAGVRTTIAGFADFAEWHGHATFMDLEEIPGLFRRKLPRRSIDNLPDVGDWLPPHTPLVRDRRPSYPHAE